MKWLMLTLLAVAHSAAFAGDGQTVEVPPSPVVRFYKDSLGFHIATNDGREITIYQYVRGPKEINLKLKQIENTCIPEQELADCTFRLDFFPMHYLFIWTKHTDPTKIGSLIDSQSGKISRPLSAYEGRDIEDLKTLTKPDRLSCSTYAWMQGIQKSNNGNFIADSWSGEQMSQNTETDVNENQSNANAFEIELKPNQNSELEVINVKSDYQSTPFVAIAPYLSNQVSNLNFKTTDNKICQVSFESSLGNAGSILTSPYFQEIDFKNLKPATYVVPSTYLFMKNLIEDQMRRLANNGEVK